MSEVDKSEAKARLENLFTESKENNEGAGIPEIVGAVLGDDADEEFTELVLMAMEDSGRISSEEILDGILKLHEWRLAQT
ncbi:MAG: hypothetical protein OSB36_06345 [Longimicrobiales bacterium]|nr:hypothetical protein [Longimicrobiales bacterium]